MNKYKTYAILTPSWTHPSLMWIKGGLLMYAGYPQSVGPYDPKYHTIVHDYGYVEDTDEALDRVEIEHVNNFPPETGFTMPTGWLLPSGDFYPCRGHEHDSMAYYIYKYVHQKVPGNYKEYSFIGHVEALGWIRIFKTVVRYKDVSLITKAQIETVLELMAKSEYEDFKNSARWLVEDYEHERGSK